MKKITIGVLGILFLLGMGKFLMGKLQITNNKSQINNKIQITKIPSPPSHYPLRPKVYRPLGETTSYSLFIPYWSSKIDSQDMSYDNYYYFGISPTAVGKIESEVGLSNMPKIVNSLQTTDDSRKKVVVRMLDASVTEALLTNEEAQKTLFEELNIILNKYSFSGIVLDLEVPFTLQPKKKDQITHFVQQICSAIKANYRTCDLLVYGDFSYRNRPYDLKKIGKSVDTLLLMAYDFHKAGGEPGPNFPLDRRSPKGGGGFDDYGYSFKQMISDVLALIPKEKIEVVYGMYGYDWTLNEQGTSLKSAEALSLNEIRALIISNHKFQITNQSQITNSKEKSIEYVDSEGAQHVIWYEDEESAAIKTKYLLEQGVSRVSFWAHSYF